MNDNINHPKHYTFGKFEVIDVIDDWQLGFALGNAVKYIARAAHKDNELEDLQKARWYIDHKIKQLNGNYKSCPEHGCLQEKCMNQYHAQGRTTHGVLK